jgi:hypothetical protein
MRLLENGAIALLPHEIEKFVRSFEPDEVAVICSECGETEMDCDCGECSTCHRTWAGCECDDGPTTITERIYARRV